MKKYAPYLSLLSLLMASNMSAQSTITNITTIKGGFKNIVIGEGCASTCVDGKCEKTCKGSKLDSESSVNKVSGRANIASKDFDFIDFDNVVIEGYNATIVKSEGFQVSVSGAQDAIEMVEVSVDVKANRSALRVALPDGYSSTTDGFVLIHMPVLSNLKAYGNTDVSMRDFEAQIVNIELSGNADLVGFANTIEQLTLRVDDNADADLMQSEIANADVSLNNQANAKLNFNKNRTGVLTGSVMGMSDVQFCGDPEQSLKVSDMSDATKLDCE